MPSIIQVEPSKVEKGVLASTSVFTVLRTLSTSVSDMYGARGVFVKICPAC